MTNICSHIWINKEGKRVSPIIGKSQNQMKYNETYKCKNCGKELKI